MRAYERLLGDAMAGDGTLFVGQDGVEAAWAVVQPILANVTPVHIYNPGTWVRPKFRSSRRGSPAAPTQSGCYLTANYYNL
jgi:glucose-6-phosphate 1-dehydrogenase